METWVAAPLLLLVAAVLFWRRRAALEARRRAGRQLSASLERSGWTLRPAGRRELELRWRGERLAGVDLALLARAVGGAGEAERQRVFAGIAGAAHQRPAILSEPYELKRHGITTLPRLASEALLLLTAGGAPVVTDPLAGAGPRVVYRLLGQPGLALVGEQQLAAAGIDARDLHGLALAVLRQRFDGAAALAAARAGGVARIAGEDGCGASRLLLLPELLGAGEALLAAAPEPGVLLVAAERQRLEDELAGLEPPAEPLAPALLKITGTGIRAA